MHRPRLIVLAATAGALLVPSAAQAATLSGSGSALTYTAASGEANNLTTRVLEAGWCASRAGECLLVQESFGVAIAPIPASCEYADTFDESVVECDVPASMTVNLGDGDDELADWSGPTTADGGAGDDGLDGNAGDDVLRGGADDDALYGEIGDDRLEGGEGDDAFEGFGVEGDDTENDTSGRDAYLGGGGTDLVDYTSRSDALTLDTDGAADDGGAGEGDTIGADVERLYAGDGDDTLTGGPAANWLYGHGGSDRLAGATGDDVLRGGVGPDDLAGEDGADQLMGDDGGDRLDGGRGVDAFDGDGGFSGADTILARDGEAETINCGAGADTATVDAADQTLFNGVGDSGCERVDRPAAATPGAATTGGGGAGGTGGGAAGAGTGQADRTVPLVSALTASSARRRLVLRFRVSEPGTATVRLQRRKGRRWRFLPGSARRSVKAGGNTLRVTRLRGRRLRPGRYRVVLRVRDAAGNQAPLRRLTVRVRR